jgi:orotate phosphoribosyltransferase
MQHDEIINKFTEAEALLEGHFILSSGLHSARYIQCARVMMYPEIASRLCQALIKKITEKINNIEVVASPAMGGVIVGYEIARQLGVPAVFFERVQGEFSLRRGFDISRNARCLMVEDIITTGLSSRECISAIKNYSNNVVGATCLIDRSMGNADLGVKLVSLTQLEIETYKEQEIPEWLEAIPITKPGSRDLK